LVQLHIAPQNPKTPDDSHKLFINRQRRESHPLFNQLQREAGGTSFQANGRATAVGFSVDILRKDFFVDGFEPSGLLVEKLTLLSWRFQLDEVRL